LLFLSVTELPLAFAPYYPAIVAIALEQREQVPALPH
jgi:hypothetical protein